MKPYVLYAAATLMMGSLASAQDTSPPDPSPPAEDPEITESIAFDRDRHNRITVPVTIEGKGPYRFMIDTGSQSTALAHQILPDLNLTPHGTATLVAMGSAAQVETVELDGLEFANRRFNGLIAPLLDAQNIGADGILGLDSLQDLRVVIDFRDDRMQVADAKELGGNNGYEIVVRARRKLGQMIITDATVDGVRTAVIIDTGAQHSMGNMALWKRLRQRQGYTLISKDVHGAEMVSQVSLVDKLKIGGLTLANVPIGYAESPAFVAMGYGDSPALVLGMRNLSPLNRVAIDFSTRRVLFDIPIDVAPDINRFDGWRSDRL